MLFSFARIMRLYQNRNKNRRASETSTLRNPTFGSRHSCLSRMSRLLYDADQTAERGTGL